MYTCIMNTIVTSLRGGTASQLIGDGSDLVLTIVSFLLITHGLTVSYCLALFPVFTVSVLS